MPILEVFDLFPASVPAFSAPFVFLKRIDAGKQSIVEERIWFPQIDDIEFDRFVFRWVGDPEVKPLRIALGIYVILEQQVILQFTYLYRFIATLYAHSRLPL